MAAFVTGYYVVSATGAYSAQFIDGVSNSDVVAIMTFQ
jgi:hypothetical protein